MHLWERYTEADMRANAPLELFELGDGTRVSVRPLQIPEADEWCKAARVVVQKERLVTRCGEKVARAKTNLERAQQRLDRTARKYEAAMELGTDDEIAEAVRQVELREKWIAEAEAKFDAAADQLDDTQDKFNHAVRQSLYRYSPNLSEEKLTAGGVTHAQIAAAHGELFQLTDPTQAGQLSNLWAMTALQKLVTQKTAMETTPTKTETTPTTTDTTQ